MDIFEAIEKRRSYRGQFSSKAISRDDLIKIVDAGVKAPSGCNCQTTDFIVVDEPELVRKIAAMNEQNKAMATAKAFVACIVNKKPVPVYQDKSFELEDCSAAVENMLLAITAMGYDTVWIDGWLRIESRNDAIGKLLNLPDSKVVQILLPIGVADEDYPSPAKKSFDQRVRFNSYQ